VRIIPKNLSPVFLENIKTITGIFAAFILLIVFHKFRRFFSEYLKRRKLEQIEKI